MCTLQLSLTIVLLMLKCTMKLKGRLKQLNADELSNISTRVIEKNRELIVVQADVLNGNLDPTLLSKARSLRKSMQFCLKHKN
ncbi:hypothetical protein LIER_07291 [Lithospermum erythrorhizon]|uniref:Uncharacterized protein n=1 Tax=Lithospermum erythrorhizon TaxID=34254 RepID=A0AAV3P7Q8_LITER